MKLTKADMLAIERGILTEGLRNRVRQELRERGYLAPSQQIEGQTDIYDALGAASPVGKTAGVRTTRDA